MRQWREIVPVLRALYGSRRVRRWLMSQPEIAEELETEKCLSKKLRNREAYREKIRLIEGREPRRNCME